MFNFDHVSFYRSSWRDEDVKKEAHWVQNHKHKQRTSGNGKHTNAQKQKRHPRTGNFLKVQTHSRVWW